MPSSDKSNTTSMVRQNESNQQEMNQFNGERSIQIGWFSQLVTLFNRCFMRQSPSIVLDPRLPRQSH